MHTSLSSLTRRVERTLEQRLVPAMYPDTEPVAVERCTCPVNRSPRPRRWP